MRKRHIFLLLIVYTLALIGSRIIWMNMYHQPVQIPIENGTLQLENWNPMEDGLIHLDGEWEFYPSHFLYGDNGTLNTPGSPPKFIPVPGPWDDYLSDDFSTSYGYGTYRLQIHTNPEYKGNYMLYIPSIRSASEIYVNGRLLANSGEVATTKENYIAKNLPYSVALIPDENEIIEIVIQATNFKDIRGSGLIRSITFGSEEPVIQKRKLSIITQITAAVVLFAHSLYAMILYFVGNRERNLMYFAIFLFSLTIMNLVSNDEKLFHLLFYVGYDWDFRLANIPPSIGLLALIQMIEGNPIPKWPSIKRVYSIILLLSAFTMLFLEAHQIILFYPVIFITMLPGIILLLVVLFKKIYYHLVENLLYLMAFIAIMSHFSWTFYWREIGIDVVHYPFDFLIFISCFAIIWFKGYFESYQETKETATKLQLLNENKDQFLANTAHEFKNPLHGMLSMTQAVIINEKNNLSASSIQDLETIVTVGRRMSILLNDLLDASRLKAGFPTIDKNTIEIAPIVTGVLDLLRYHIGAKPVKIIQEIPDDFPKVIADQNRLIQVLYNLLHNAIKFTNEGTITIRAEQKNKMARISIIDTGIGMDKTFLNRLFQPYEQFIDSKLNAEGFGLGLNISKQLIELQGGRLIVSSTRGKGTVFSFSMPITPEQLEGSEKEIINTDMISVPILDESKSTDDNANSFEQMEKTWIEAMQQECQSILIVDDDPINLQVLQSILPREYYDITTALDGEEALRKLASKKWSLVITDIMMPNMSGYELTEKIRKRYSLTELPILLLSARNQPQDIQAGFLAGANDYVTKPVEMMELKARVAALTAAQKSVQQQLKLEAAWLQAQIQPHFLFNTLNSILALSEFDIKQMKELLIDFSNFLRSKSQFKHEDQLISLDDELNIVRSYLNIEQVRFGEHLQVTWEIDDVNDINIPFLTIQPLVENAVLHGVLKHAEGGTVTIKVMNHDEFVEVLILDDGAGMSDEKIQQLLQPVNNQDSFTGILNVNKRLKQQFGEGLSITSTINKGTTVSFKIPKLTYE